MLITAAETKPDKIVVPREMALMGGMSLRSYVSGACGRYLWPGYIFDQKGWVSWESAKNMGGKRYDQNTIIDIVITPVPIAHPDWQCRTQCQGSSARAQCGAAHRRTPGGQRGRRDRPGARACARGQGDTCCTRPCSSWTETKKRFWLMRICTRWKQW